MVFIRLSDRILLLRQYTQSTFDSIFAQLSALSSHEDRLATAEDRLATAEDSIESTIVQIAADDVKLLDHDSTFAQRHIRILALEKWITENDSAFVSGPGGYQRPSGPTDNGPK